ncbi:MAG: hypothetical protein C4547_08355 [Phycisphaerales bacterium]|nr:MAG: hypothetical protein C4547_08355 [Phycisphaerales bacterium]
MWTINNALSSLFDLVFDPMASWPAWLSLGLISAVTGVVLLLAYRYTSNQDAIGRARDDIKANMLAMKLYKDSLMVAMGAQFRVAWSSFKILLLSIPPLMVALIPVGALFVQMTGRYQFAPVPPGKTATVQAFMTEEFGAREVAGQARFELAVPEGVELLTARPWRKHDSTLACWKVRADKPGLYDLTVRAGDESLTKLLPVGDGASQPVSPLRTRYSFWEKLGFPWEEYPPQESSFRAIQIREVIETAMPDVLPVPVLGNWIVYFLVVSMAFALVFKPIFKVRI